MKTNPQKLGCTTNNNNTNHNFFGLCTVYIVLSKSCFLSNQLVLLVNTYLWISCSTVGYSWVRISVRADD